MSLIWIWCLFFKSLNSCFRHLKGLRLASSRDQNCELQLIFQRTDRSLNYCRWLQTVRDVKLESFSKISLEKVWKGERWVSNTEISFERLWTLLVDVVLRVSYGVFVVSNFSVYLLAEILMILLIYCIWWCHSFKGRSIMSLFSWTSGFWKTIILLKHSLTNSPKSSPFQNWYWFMNFKISWVDFPTKKDVSRERWKWSLASSLCLATWTRRSREVAWDFSFQRLGVVGRFAQEQPKFEKVGKMVTSCGLLHMFGWSLNVMAVTSWKFTPNQWENDLSRPIVWQWWIFVLQENQQAQQLTRGTTKLFGSEGLGKSHLTFDLFLGESTRNLMLVSSRPQTPGSTSALYTQSPPCLWQSEFHVWVFWREIFFWKKSFKCYLDGTKNLYFCKYSRMIFWPRLVKGTMTNHEATPLAPSWSSRSTKHRLFVLLSLPRQGWVLQKNLQAVTGWWFRGWGAMIFVESHQLLQLSLIDYSQGNGSRNPKWRYHISDRLRISSGFLFHFMFPFTSRPSAGLDALSKLLASWCRFGMGSPGLVWVMCALKPCLKAHFWVDIMAEQLPCWNFSGEVWFWYIPIHKSFAFHLEVVFAGKMLHLFPEGCIPIEKCLQLVEPVIFFETTMISKPNNFIQHSQPTGAKFGCLTMVFSFSWWGGWLHFCCALLHGYEIYMIVF